MEALVLGMGLGGRMVLETSRWVPGVGAALAGPQGHIQSLALC